jgi:hypothetical protein
VIKGWKNSGGGVFKIKNPVKKPDFLFRDYNLK